MKTYAFRCALVFLGASLSLPASVLIFPDLTVSASNTTGVSFTLTSDYLPTDTIDVAVSGTVDLSSGDYTANAAGIIIGPATTNTGNHPGQTSPNLSDPSVPNAALLIGNNTLGFFQLFPSDAANGLGNSTPPTDLSSFATIGSLFAGGLTSGTQLTLEVSDCAGCSGDNSGSFQIGAGDIQISSTPEPVTVGSVGLGILLLAWARRRSNA